MTEPKLWTDEECRPFETGWRPAEILYWYDADTPMVRIDVGFTINGPTQYVRLLTEGTILTPLDKSDDKVDAWELRRSERPLGLIAKARVQELIPDGSEVRVWSFKGKGKTGKYGRWLVVMLYRVEGGWRSIGDVLLQEGHADRPDY